MPIRWNALDVQTATEEIEAETDKVKEPLKAARDRAEKALTIPNIPDYIKQGFQFLISDIDRVIGEKSRYSDTEFPGCFDKGIARIRKDIPKDSLESAKRTADLGERQALV